MERRDFLKKGLKTSAVIIAGSSLESVSVSSAEKTRVSVDADSMSKAALEHFLPGKKTCVESILLAGSDALDISVPVIPNFGQHYRNA